MNIRNHIVWLAILALVASCADTERPKEELARTPRKITRTKAPEQSLSNKLLYLDTATDIRNVLCQGWVNEDDERALGSMTESSNIEIPYRSFYLSPEGSFIKNPRNAIDYGAWEYNEQQKTITFTNTIDNRKDLYKIVALAPDELRLLNLGLNTSTILVFVSRAKRFRNHQDDPFYIGNNNWRLQPSGPESDEAIRERLKDNIHFFILYYRASIERNDPEVSFWGLPSPFKWYGGGIYLKREDELPANWIRCFYNKQQAMKAYKLANRLLERKYVWPKKERNWLKLNLAVLEQMYRQIDNL